MFRIYHIGGLEDLEAYDPKTSKSRLDGEIDKDEVSDGDLAKWFYENEGMRTMIIEESKKWTHRIVCTGYGDIYIVEEE